MKYKHLLLAAAITTPISFPAFGDALQHFEMENGTLLEGGYTGTVSEPFAGVGAYGNNDGIETSAVLDSIPGVFRIDIRGASSNDSAAGISVYLGGERVGATQFTGSQPSIAAIEFRLKQAPANNVLRFVLETDSGKNDTFLDWFELHRIGDVMPTPAAPTPPNLGAFYSGQYRNMFAEFGYANSEIQNRVRQVYDQLFHSDDLVDEAIFIPVGNDMAYIWDTGNDDVRSEGMSYGMMMAVQLDRQDDFNKLWQWANTYSLNKTGPMTGYFAWQVSTDGKVMDSNPAPDGEEYMAMALFFASHRWGDGSGIFNYGAEANKLLNTMYLNGETRANGEPISLFYHPEQQIIFSPAMNDDRTFTDPSYHLPAFYELWSRWADNHNEFWAGLATTSRRFWRDAAHETTGLTPDYAYFSGEPHGQQDSQKVYFQYDAWRTIGNAGMDYSWWAADSWQTTWANRLQAFFATQGVTTYGGLYKLNGEVLENNKDHSPGLVAMNAVAALAASHVNSWEFVENLWDTRTPTGQYRYYDGCLYLFGMLASSGNFKMYCPGGKVCGAGAGDSSSSQSSSGLGASSRSSANSSAGSNSENGSTGGSLGWLIFVAAVLLGGLLPRRQGFGRDLG